MSVFYQFSRQHRGSFALSTNKDQKTIDIETSLTTIELNGGKVITPKTKIEAKGRGYFAVFSDNEGNRIGLYSNK